MAKAALTPQQARSRESETKLIKAALAVLAQFGLEGATVPRVAEHAGLTPGALYRRFPDKNALLERCIIRILEDQLTHLRASFTEEAAQRGALRVLIGEIIRAMLQSYRKNATLIRALRRFVQSSDHAAFKHQAAQLERAAMSHMATVLMTQRAQMSHPDPQSALTLALLMLTATLAELVMSSDNPENWQPLIPDDDAFLEQELTRMFLSYVGVDAGQPG